jgi:hypothetical protein
VFISTPSFQQWLNKTLGLEAERKSDSIPFFFFFFAVDGTQALAHARQMFDH